MPRVTEELGYTPGLALFTCDGCRDVAALAARAICARFDRILKKNEAGQQLRCAECLVGCRGELND